MKHYVRRSISIVAMFAMIFGLNFGFVRFAKAATITNAKITLSTVASAAQGTHAFSFTTITSLTAGQTIILMYNEGTSDWTLDGTITDTDFSGATNLTFVANVGACGGGATNEVYPTVTNGANDFYTLTVCTSDTVPAGATAFTIDNNEITNPTTVAAEDYTVDITTTSDTGSVAVGIVPDDSVNVTATVDPSITFSISDTTVGFGILSTTVDCWANGTPPTNCDTTFPPPAAHTLSAGTNASGGLAVTYNGATLTDGAKNIDVATITGDTTNPVGDPGTTEQFAIGFDDNGSTFTMASGYDQNAGDYKFVASTTTTIFSSAAPVTATSVDAHYLANITAATPAGSYSTNITYIATGTF